MTVKFVALVPVPPGVVTETVPVVAPVGTVAVIEVYGDAEAENVALTPLNVIEVARPKPEPLIVTEVPTGPDVVPRLVILGTILKFDALFAVPPAVVTEINPDVAAVGIAAVICVGESTVNDAMFTPLTLTAVTPKNPDPVIITDEPTIPLAGAKLPTEAVTV